MARSNGLICASPDILRLIILQLNVCLVRKKNFLPIFICFSHQRFLANRWDFVHVGDFFGRYANFPKWRKYRWIVLTDKFCHYPRTDCCSWRAVAAELIEEARLRENWLRVDSAGFLPHRPRCVETIELFALSFFIRSETVERANRWRWQMFFWRILFLHNSWTFFRIAGGVSFGIDNKKLNDWKTKLPYLYFCFQSVAQVHSRLNFNCYPHPFIT